MLSKEFQNLALKGLVKCTILNTKPIAVEYFLTDYGRTVKPIIEVSPRFSPLIIPSKVSSLSPYPRLSLKIKY